MAAWAGGGRRPADEPVGDEPEGDAQSGDRSHSDVGHSARRAQVRPGLRNSRRHHPTTTGLLIALPYGTRADWLRNVLAAGSASVVTQGKRIDVERPKIVATADVEDLIPRRTLRTLRLFGVNQCLHLEKS